MDNDQKPRRTVPTVSRVHGDTIFELVYDADRRKTGLVVSRFGGLWNIETEATIGTGEVLVPYAASNNLIANECVLLASKPVFHGGKEELIADIRAFLHRFMDLSPLFEQIAAHYVLLTWVYDAFGELPYLRLQGDYGTGKTRGLLAIGSLCYKPFFGSGASSTSAIFRTLDAFGGTLILDEADLPYSDARADLVKIFNNGTVRGMPVLKTAVSRNKEFDPVAFKVFGPKIIAMRGSFQDAALESRFLTEQTGMRHLRGDIPLHLPAELKKEALQLRNRLLHFRLAEYFDVKTDLSAIVPDIEPRLNQSALSLLSLMDDHLLRRQVQNMLISLSENLAAERQSTAEGRVLSAVLAAISATKAKAISLSEIARRFNEANASEYGQPMSNKWIGYILRNRLQIVPHKSTGIYVVPASEFPKLEALSHRYKLATHRNS